jgi:hypothetical protein
MKRCQAGSDFIRMWLLPSSGTKRAPGIPVARMRPSLKRHRGVAAGMHDQCGRLNPRQIRRDVDLAEGVVKPLGTLGRCGPALELVVPFHVLGRRAGHHETGEELAERRVVLAPAMGDQGRDGPAAGNQLRVPPLRPAPGIAAQEDHAAHPVGIARGEGCRHGASLGMAKERCPRQSVGVHHGEEIADHGIQGDVLDLAVGEPIAALVVPDQRVVPGKIAEPVMPDRTFPIVIEMRQPMGGLHQDRAGTHAGIGNADAVGGGAEPDLLRRDITTLP